MVKKERRRRQKEGSKEGRIGGRQEVDEGKRRETGERLEGDEVKKIKIKMK